MVFGSLITNGRFANKFFDRKLQNRKKNADVLVFAKNIKIYASFNMTTASQNYVCVQNDVLFYKFDPDATAL